MHCHRNPGAGGDGGSPHLTVILGLVPRITVEVQSVRRRRVRPSPEAESMDPRDKPEDDG